jgi:uncharacterized iron-regulated protein
MFARTRCGFKIAAILCLGAWLGSAPAAACSIAPAIGSFRLENLATPAHPLIGGIWDGKRFSPASEFDTCLLTGGERALSAAFREAKILLLGEIHDNPDHHKARAHWLEGQHRGYGAPEALEAIAFEQIRADQQAGLRQFAEFNQTAARLGTSGDLKRFLEWDKSAWSKMADYTPLFDAAIAARLPIYAADPPREVIRKAAKEGIAAALSEQDRHRLELDQPLGAGNDAASLAEIEESHCGMIPKSAQPNMAEAQRYRDAFMADQLLKAAEANGRAILIAGNGHVRADRGVPWYIRQRAPDKKVVSVMLIEVEAGKTDPEAYVPRDAEGNPVTDFIVFTARSPTRDRDPCEGMKRAEK